MGYTEVAPHQTHSNTSAQAAAKIRPSAGTLRQQVFDYLESCGAHGATDEEMQRALGMNPSTQRPRRIELMEDYETVFRAGVKRETTSGRKAEVWVVRAYAADHEIAAQVQINAELKRGAKAGKAAASVNTAAPVSQESPAPVPVAAPPTAAVATPPTSPWLEPSEAEKQAKRKLFTEMKRSLAVGPKVAPKRDPFDLSLP